jgi:hypothetical protein
MAQRPKVASQVLGQYLQSFRDLNAGLALSPTGVLYGTTSAGGSAGKGTVFG